MDASSPNDTSRTTGSSVPSISFFRARLRSYSSFFIVSCNAASSSNPSDWRVFYSNSKNTVNQRVHRRVLENLTVHSRLFSLRPSFRLRRYCKSVSFCMSCSDTERQDGSKGRGKNAVMQTFSIRFLAAISCNFLPCSFLFSVILAISSSVFSSTTGIAKGNWTIRSEARMLAGILRERSVEG